MNDRQHFRARHKCLMWDHDPDTSAATVTTPDAGTTKRSWDMRYLGRFVAIAMSSRLTGNGVSLLEIVASDAADMSTNLTVIRSSGAVLCDSVGDQVVLEIAQEDVAQAGSVAGADLRYVAARVTVANSADEAVVTYIGYDGDQRLDLTPATTIA